MNTGLVSPVQHLLAFRRMNHGIVEVQLPITTEIIQNVHNCPMRLEHTRVHECVVLLAFTSLSIEFGDPLHL